ncbi:S8 family serine peptidase [Aridibaculum aurantiacum]|uniref:S8 family serine peptidase n=1 Tax=Aridibaculum aurantiacum TaxID=2810307 RepID=UPI001A965C57|nr:S8 family serine peptidase [Aridibaculum aurantiacum]
MKKPLPKRNAHLLLAMAAIGISISASAQSPEQRKQVQAASNVAALNKQLVNINSRLQRDEAAVQAYLQRTPGAKRYFEKNGSLYYIKYIDAQGNPVYINTKNVESCDMIGANQLHPGGSVGANIDGTGMVAGIWDGGQVRSTHELLAGKVTMQAGQTLNSTKGNNHMTHVSGTMVGKVLANQPSARGIAFGATARNYDWTSDQAEMTAFATSGFLISNHSYGLANDNTTPVWQFGAYDQEAQQWDEIAKNAPLYLPFVAAGNEQSANGNMTKAGFDLISGASAAKNVMTVGALNGDSTMSDYSNWGPTDDGRFKPDLVAKGTGINSSEYATDQTYSGNGVNSSGTSYATPAAAAVGLLLQQYHHQLAGSYMRSATLKAVMMHTAHDLGNPGPDYKFGWGLLSADKAGNLIKKAKTSATPQGAIITEFTTNPANDGVSEIPVTVTAAGNEPLIVSIAWTDDEGTEQTATDPVDQSTGRLVHHFDFMVRHMATFTDTRPWRPMGMANRTQNAAKGTAWFQNDNNNYRQVIIENPVAGATYTIYIRKASTSPADVKPFSLVVSGTQASSPLPITLVSLTATAAGADNIIRWQTAGESGTTGYDVEKSLDGRSFSKIGTVTNTGAGSRYELRDGKPTAGINYYRLKETKQSGSFEYSDVVFVKRTAVQAAITVSPVPARSHITITNIDRNLNGTEARISDVSGKVIKTFTMQSMQVLDVAAFQPGTYVLTTQSGSIKIVKQ